MWNKETWKFINKKNDFFNVWFYFTKILLRSFWMKCDTKEKVRHNDVCGYSELNSVVRIHAIYWHFIFRTWKKKKTNIDLYRSSLVFVLLNYVCKNVSFRNKHQSPLTNVNNFNKPSSIFHDLSSDDVWLCIYFEHFFNMHSENTYSMLWTL